MKKKQLSSLLYGTVSCSKMLACMKLIIIFTVLFWGNVSAKLHSQTRVTLSMQKASYEQVFMEIEKKTDFSFIFNNGMLPGKRIDINVKNEPVINVLKTILVDTDLDYKIVQSNLIVIVRKTTSKEGFLNDTQQFSALAITGTVKDAGGNSLSGVNIIEKGTTNATASDNNGNFSITVQSESATLIFTYVGFAAKEVAVGSQRLLAIELVSAVTGLDDVVVVGYGTQKKINSTGAIASIGTKELVQSPVANISNSLVGRMPGLFATQAGGEPGNDGSTIRIRGVATFTGNTNPLILVDGIEVANYNNIDPNEIESLTILKDASSTAVYGIRGANGVLIITTKRGKSGPPQVSYTFNQGFNSFTNLRTSMTGAEYAIGYNAAQRADAYATNSTYTPRFSATDIELFQSGEDPVFHPSHNWFEEMFRKISTQSQHNLNISGGQKKVRYFISGGFFNQQGLFKDLTDIIPDFNAQSTYKRYNIRSNFNFEVTESFKIALDLSSQTEIRNGNNNVNGTERVVGDIARASPIDGPGVVDGKIVNINTSNTNPYAALLFPNNAGGVRRSYRNYLNGSLRLDHDLGFITTGLTTHVNAALSTYNNQDIVNSKVLISYMAYRLPDGSINYVPNNTETQFGFSQSGTFSRRITAEAGIDYKRTFGGHNVTGLLLYNQQKTYDPAFAFLVPRGYQSYVGRATYNHLSRYLVEINVGYNGSENFAPGKRFGFFPAYSLGWVASEEPFFPRKSAVNFLKFRASYGEVGYDQIGGNRFLYNPTSYSSYSSIYYFGNIGTNFAAYNGIREGATGNPNVTWERAVKKDIGVDIRLLNDKISITGDVFQENRDNILALPQTISAITGLLQPSTNLGSMENKGYEGEVTYNTMMGRVSFRVSANYSFARNKVLFRDEIPPAYAYQRRTGQRLGQTFALINEGIFNTWEDVNDAKRPVYQGTNRLQPGDLKYRDINGDGLINDFDAVPVGYSNIPEKTFGVSLSASYKGFDVSVLFQGVGNVSMYYSRFQRIANYGENPPAGAAAYLNESWTPERYAAGLPINFPRFSLISNSNNFGSTFYLADASYLRLKNTEIGYTARPGVLKRIGISSCRLYVNANNLVTWSNVYPGVDPETTPLSDVNQEPYPLVRTINAGLNVNF